MGILSWIFKKRLVMKLENDPEFISMVDKADESAENLRCTIRKAESRGVIIPDGLKRSAGMKITKQVEKKE